MRVIAKDGSHEIEIQRSRFLCTVGRIGDEDEAAAFIADIRSRHRAANHNCTAFRVGVDTLTQRSSDDGEPGGTAGVPMLEVLTRKELTDTVAVVTRYFGGVKLGAGGLVRAYGRAVSEAVDALGTVRLTRFATVLVTVGHTDAGKLRNALDGAGHRVDDAAYTEAVTFTVRVPEAELVLFETWLASQTGGTATVALGEPVDLDMPER